MKNYICIELVFVLFMSNMLQAQATEPVRQLAIKVGFNNANVYHAKTEAFTVDPRFGWVAGGVLQLPITQVIRFQPEVLLSQKGFLGTGRLLGSAYYFSRTSIYIDIAMQLAIKPTGFLTLVIGPQVACLIHQKDEFDASSTSFLQEEVFKADRLRKSVLGAVVGMDVRINSFMLGGRIGWDLTNNKYEATSNTPTYRNMWLQGTLGYTLYNSQ